MVNLLGYGKLPASPRPRVTASSFTLLWQSDVLNLEEDQTPGEVAVGQLEFGLR